MKKTYPSLLLGVLMLFGAAGLPGCSKAPEEKSNQLKEGYGKTIDPYEKKDNGRLGAAQRKQAHDPYAKPPGKPEHDPYAKPPGKPEHDPYARPPGK